jgi:acetate kinase
MRVLVVNTGSSSLKLRLLDADDRVVATLDLEEWAGGGASDRVAAFVAEHGAPDAVGHRVVHGGPTFHEPVVLDAESRKVLEGLTDLAPLHQPRALAGIDAVTDALPDTPAVACFDTSFHADLPPAAATYAVPHEWTTRWRLRRYGFHGLSHGYAARRAAAMVGRPVEELRLVSCHLGAGASLAAVSGGRSVDTTMGFTPLEGLVMASRSGSVDPGMLLWLVQHEGMDVGELSEALSHRAGLAGFVGGTGDMREVLSAARSGDRLAALAFDVYLHQLRKHIAAMAAAMSGLDVLIFTGGVGEHQPPVRSAAAAGLGFLGIRLDEDRNANTDSASATGDADIGDPTAPVRTLVIAAREDLEIARMTRAALAS